MPGPGVRNWIGTGSGLGVGGDFGGNGSYMAPVLPDSGLQSTRT